MEFIVVDGKASRKEKNVTYLAESDWDDWFTYSTVYAVVYIDNDGIENNIGEIKIGQKGQKGRRPNIPKRFISLDDNFFSLGTSDYYYGELIRMSTRIKSFRVTLLKNLKDIAFDLKLFSDIENEDVTRVSLLRDVTISTIKGQYNRMANGGSRLTKYNFSYTYNYKWDSDNEPIELTFLVKPESMPPTNIHVLIGKNGVGKTTLLRNIVRSLEYSSGIRYGAVAMNRSREKFANILFISFSAFDEYIKIDKEPVIPYTYVGLTSDDGKKKKTKIELADEFTEGLLNIKMSDKKDLWIKAIESLESDITFIELDIKSWLDIEPLESEREDLKKINPRKSGEITLKYIRRIRKIYFKEKVSALFDGLSSGHKIILLTITNLIEKVEEKTLVLLDEPEEHLHPPLVAAFIRALSELLIYRNGVGIIATHSPVIVQEVPKKCTWIIRKCGDSVIAERPSQETFGESIGILNSEIFGYEVTNSGFHKMIKEVIEKEDTYDDVLDIFNDELGMEAKSMVQSLMYIKNQVEEPND